MSPGGFKRTQEAAANFFDDHFRENDLGGVVVNGQLVNDRLTSETITDV